MFKVTQNFQSGVVEVIVDLRDDMTEIPTHYGVGSTCFVIEDSSVWMLGNDAQWHEIG